VRLVLHVWRQKNREAKGAFVRYEAPDASPDMSFLELLDVINERLIVSGEQPIAFDHDCREGICGSCGMVINGVAHGPMRATATCELYLRHFKEGEEIVVEPWRAAAFPLIKDLVVDRSALDRIIATGGFVTAETGSAPDGNAILVPKGAVEEAMDAAACIGCGACVAACPNGSASLFTAAKIAHLGLLPQGQPERPRRVLAMVAQMDHEGFGNCTWHGECQEACPKSISIDTIARMNHDWLAASIRPAEKSRAEGAP
jgi:succinate dehydrogenase / fumarate reductase iron-sulfur subunit